jgi:hypothetical protein
MTDGKKFEGQWSEDEQNGEGVLTNEKGYSRKGTWKAGVRVEWIGSAYV